MYLAAENIDHSTTRARSPQPNGIVERFQKTMLDEFYQIAFRNKIYRSVEELQEDVDAWARYYNEKRPHSGRHCYGKTPMQKYFQDSLIIAVGSTDITMFMGTTAAYSTSRFQFGGKFLPFWILSTRMFPPNAIISPVFILMTKLSLVDTYYC